jgi:hypothetical protein
MKPSPRTVFFSALAALAASATLASFEAVAQSGLTRLNGPKGGEIVFGPITGVSAVPGAMGAVLRMLHQRFGARPEVGRVVEVQGTGSSTLRFLVKPPQGQAVGGMIIVAQGAQGFEAGVVYDEPSHLATSFSPMLQALTEAWHPVPSGTQGGPGGAQGPSAPPAPLRNVGLNDNSASVGLPYGWRISPESAGGTILANGPNGETAALGAPYRVIDNGTAQGRAMQQRAMGGNLRNTIYSTALYYPYGQSLSRTFADLSRMTGERMHSPRPLRVESEYPLADRNGMHCARLQGEGGIEAGRGPGRFDTVFCAAPPSQGQWMTMSYFVAAPSAAFEAERATLLAVRSSFQPNQAVIAQQAARIAAPVIAQIHEIGRQATLRAAEADRTRIEMRNNFESYNNTRDRLAQGFTNYQRDNSVIFDRDTNTHATTWNSVADEMVKNNPQRYGIVDTPGYWKGVDY